MSNPRDLYREVSVKMEKSIATLMQEFQTLGFERASSGLLENLSVDVYGQKMPLKNIANISVIGSKDLSVNVWDRNNVSLIDKAIRTSKLDLNPRIEGNKLLITLPTLTTDRKKEFIKMAKAKTENAKVAIRGHRRAANDTLKKLNKDGELNDDELKKELKTFQNLTDEKIAKLEDLLKNKEKSLLDF